jgi:hypothetical protein
MKTTRHSELVRTARDPKNVEAARSALVDAQQQLADLRRQMDAVPARLASPEARRAVEDALRAAGDRGLSPAESKAAVAQVGDVELRAAAERALGEWQGYKNMEPALESLVAERKVNADGLATAHALATRLPFVARAAAFLLDKLESRA